MSGLLQSRKRKTKPSSVDQEQTTLQDVSSTSSDIRSDSNVTSSEQSLKHSVKEENIQEEPPESLADKLESCIKREHLIVDQIKSLEIRKHATKHESTESNSTVGAEGANALTGKPTVSQTEHLEASLTKRQLEKYNFEKFLNANKQILSTLESIHSIPSRPATATQSIKSESQQSIAEEFNIKPYTEQQLKSLYCNSELEILEEFTKTYIDTELKSIHSKKHYLYDLLVHYLKVREKITGKSSHIQGVRFWS